MSRGGRTENERLRRMLRNRAVARALTILGYRYEEEFAALRAQIVEEGPDLSRQVAYQRARRALRDRHRHEYDVMVVVLNDSLQKEAGYESQAHLGHANLRNNKTRVDTSAHQTGE